MKGSAERIAFTQKKRKAFNPVDTLKRILDIYDIEGVSETDKVSEPARAILRRNGANGQPGPWTYRGRLGVGHDHTLGKRSDFDTAGLVDKIRAAR